MITGYNFFAHLKREIDIKRLTEDLQTLSTLPKDIYGYSHSMWKHMPEDALKTFQKHLMYPKK